MLTVQTSQAKVEEKVMEIEDRCIEELERFAERIKIIKKGKEKVGGTY